MNTKLPGVSQLTIEAMDYDLIGGDDLIGRTIVDLEDRLFLQEWKDLGAAVVAGDAKSEKWKDKRRYPLKPVELRGLFIPTSTGAQGTLEVWVDILTPSEASEYPMLDVSLPPPLKFEMRMVVWKAKEMVNMDEFEGMNDLFGSVRFCSLKEQKTDIHWRAKSGKGSFNWRLKFPIELGFGLEHSDFPRLTVQMWDKDIITSDDCIAETVLDLKDYMKTAYKTKSRLQIFQDSDAKKAAREKKLKKKGALPKEDGKQTEGYKKLDDEPGCLDKIKFWKKTKKDGSAEAEGLIGDDEVGEKEETPEELKARRDKEKAEAIATAGGGDDDAAEFINSLKEMSGLFPELDPPNSTWLKMMRKDNEGKMQPMGKVCISMELVPEADAEIDPVAFGRGDPNHSPYCPPPVGRLKFSWNPFSMIKQFVGPKVCCYCMCVLACAVFILLMIYAGPVLNLLITIFLA